jgi:hypothetical protein
MSCEGYEIRRPWFHFMYKSGSCLEDPGIVTSDVSRDGSALRSEWEPALLDDPNLNCDLPGYICCFLACSGREDEGVMFLRNIGRLLPTRYHRPLNRNLQEKAYCHDLVVA